MNASQPAFTRADPDARRQSLIEACARVLAARGAAGVSVRAICAEAGVSAGLLRHYFPTLSHAIAATCLWVGGEIEAALCAAVAEAEQTSRARLVAYLGASFRSPIASGDLLASYVALWSLSLTDPLVAAARGEVYGTYREGLAALLAVYRPQLAGAGLATIALTALVDGLWLELSLGKAPFTPAEAEALAARWLDTLAG